MIIVTGSIRARTETIDQIVALALAHVRRSRLEPGCLLHTVHRDVEDPLRLVFLEHWEDADSLRAHFQVPESGSFVNDAAALAAGPPDIQIYEAHKTRV